MKLGLRFAVTAWLGMVCTTAITIAEIGAGAKKVCCKDVPTVLWDTLTIHETIPPDTLLVARPDPNPYGRDFYEGLYPDSIIKYVDSMEPHPIWWWPVDEYGYPLTRDSVEALGIDAESFLAR